MPKFTKTAIMQSFVKLLESTPFDKITVKDIVDDCYRKAKEIILEHMDVLNRCAELLLVKEKIGREEFEALFDSREICKQDNHVMEN